MLASSRAMALLLLQLHAVMTSIMLSGVGWSPVWVALVEDIAIVESLSDGCLDEGYNQNWHQHNRYIPAYRLILYVHTLSACVSRQITIL